MDATTEFRPSPSFFQPTSEPKGAAAGRNPYPFAFRSIPMLPERVALLYATPPLFHPLHLAVLPPQPRSPGVFAAPKAASRAAEDVLSAAPFAHAHNTNAHNLRGIAAPSRRGGSRPRIPIPSNTLPTTPRGALPRVPTLPTPTPTKKKKHRAARDCPRRGSVAAGRGS